MDQHQFAFIEEAKELLSQLEDDLLALEESPDNAEMINAVFRALHTIKGSGSMFGFEKVEHFTHDLENAFEKVRNGAVHVSRELIDLTLAARDEIQNLVRIAEDDQPDSRADARTLILQKLQILMGSGAPAADHAPHSPNVEKADTDSTMETFRISFRPEIQAYAHGSDPLLILAELRDLGELTVTPNLEGIPPLETLEPETCHFAWEMLLKTDAGENAVRDVFIFVGDDCDLEITKVSGGAENTEEEPGETPIKKKESSPGTAPAAVQIRTKNHVEQKNQSTVRVPSERLDKMVNLVGELVIAQARLSQLSIQTGCPEIAAVAEEIERLTSDMRDTTMGMRMVPIGSVFGKYKRIVRDLARDLGKQVEIETSGGETELDKTVIERLHDPMVHLIRNAIDHGIESPTERTAAGKQECGWLELTATHSGAYVLISVVDDGAGLDRDRILTKAIERGLTAPDSNLTDREIYDFILQPGFSTKQEVSALSGRGVGMDVVAKSIQQLGGRIQIDSERGEGTTITMRLPLTLAIIDGLQVRIGDSDYVLPLGVIEECVEMTESQLVQDRYRHILNLRDEMVPYISLRHLFGVEGDRPNHEKIVIINDDGNRFGIVVDLVVGELQAVIKPLGKLCRDIAEVSGATILGDGTVALILDLGRIFDAVYTIEDTQKSK
ncbi:MAG: chemotaxis protein CheA [Pontiellaceae bacterium]|nr:chemotaxis protein CheA [Pontiellaceae bacterium]MBN2785906.1 chemotaxis protein CheA [Pontiellaceae bacterium]